MGIPVPSSQATKWKLDGTNFKLLYGVKKAEKQVPVFKLRAAVDDASLTWKQNLYTSGKYAPYGKDNSATLFFDDGNKFDFAVTSPEGEKYEFTAEIDYVTPSPRYKVGEGSKKKKIDFQFNLLEGSIDKFLEFASYYEPEKYSGDIASESTALARSAASFRNPSTWMWRGGSRMGNRGYTASFIHFGSDHGRPTQHVRLTSYCTRNNFPYRDGHHRECVRNHHFFRGIPTDEWSKLRWNFGATNAFRTHLVEFQMSHTKWNGSDFTESVLSGSNFAHTQFRDSTFNRARMLNTNFHRADMRGATFNNANITVRDWRGADLRDTDWIGANVRRHRNERSTFQNANFTGANLTGAQFDQNLDFSGANFTDVICPNGTPSNGNVCDWANM